MATVLDPPSTISPEEFLKLPERELYELVDGELVETLMSMEAAWVASQINRRLTAFVDEHQLGAVFTSDATYQCFPDSPGTVRRPDVSFIARGRLSEDQFSEGHCLIPPDLAVEVISPNDLLYALEQKVEDYRSAGVKLIWVASPKSRSITAYRPKKKPTHFEAGDVLNGENVVPGFEVAVSELFPQKQAIL